MPDKNSDKLAVALLGEFLFQAIIISKAMSKKRWDIIKVPMGSPA